MHDHGVPHQTSEVFYASDPLHDLTPIQAASAPPARLPVCTLLSVNAMWPDIVHCLITMKISTRLACKEPLFDMHSQLENDRYEGLCTPDI